MAKRFTPFVGHDITIGQLVETANAVSQMYKDRGYALSFAFVPAQDFANGVVRVTVVEGYVKDIKIKGDCGNLEKEVRAIARHIAADRPLRTDTFQRYVQILGMIPGTKIDATVAPPQNTDDATTLELNVTRKRFKLSSGIDMNLPGLSGIFSATGNGMLGLGESIPASALAPPGRNDSSYHGINAMVPIGSDGFSMKVDASHYYGHPKDSPGLPSYIERTVVNDKLALSAVYPFILSNTRSLLATATVYATHDEDRMKNMAIATNPQLTNRSQVRVAQIALDFTGVQPDVTRRANLTLSKAMDVFGASKTTETNIPGLALTNPISLTFFKSGATYTQTNVWPFKIGTTVQMTSQFAGHAAHVRTDFLRRDAFRARLSAGRRVRRFGLGRVIRSEPSARARMGVSQIADAVRIDRCRARVPARRHAAAAPAVVGRRRFPCVGREALQYRSVGRAPSAMRRSKAARATRASTRRFPGCSIKCRSGNLNAS